MSKVAQCVIKNKQDLIIDLVERFKDIGKRAIEKRGRFSIALSGGKTPSVFYQQLSKFQDSEFWKKTHVFLTDERHVSFHHPANNFRMIKETLLDQVKIPAGNIHPMVSELEIIPLENVVENYKKDLKSFFFPASEIPDMDFLLLGIGHDGHAASIFPGTPQMEEKTEWVVSSQTPAVEHRRISLTFPVINQGRYVFFLVTGAQKAEIIRDIFQNKKRFPASCVSPARGELIYFLDPSAAQLLSQQRTS